MTRYSRSQFAAFGVLPAINVLALLLYCLNLATRGTPGGAGRSLPVVVGIAAFVLLTSFWAASKRGRDVGLAGWIAFIGCLVTTAMGPMVFVLYGYLALAKGNAEGDRFGPPAEPAGVLEWLFAMVNLAWPWFAVLVAAKLM